jgi:hypothetical protein
MGAARAPTVYLQAELARQRPAAAIRAATGWALLPCLCGPGRASKQPTHIRAPIPVPRIGALSAASCRPPPPL